MIKGDIKALHSFIAKQDARGFTLVEVMIAMMLGMMILAALFTLFSSQSTIYKNQGSRVAAGQDAGFIAAFIASDLRSAIESPVGSTDANATNVTITDVGNFTTTLTFDVWGPLPSVVPPPPPPAAPPLRRERRRYRLVQSGGGPGTCNPTDRQYMGIDWCLRYDSDITGVDNTVDAGSEIMQGVTMFRVLRDDPGNAAAAVIRALYPNMPPPRPPLNTGGVGGVGRQLARFQLANVIAQLHDSTLGSAAAFVPSYTIVLEIAVESASLGTQVRNARGQAVNTIETPPRKRIIRYLQVYPMSMVP